MVPAACAWAIALAATLDGCWACDVVGFYDHCACSMAAVAAVALKAEIIELDKHMQLDSNNMSALW